MKIAALVGLAGCLAAGCAAQEPVKATACELVTHPEKYAGKLVEVRAWVHLAFEDFTLDQTGCEDAFPWVWLMYGGDEATPTMSTVNDTERRPGTVVKVDGVPIPLLRDASLKEFRAKLYAYREGPIDKFECYDCHLYRITATLTGMFFARRDAKKPHTGYGHMGCCNLLAIERVEDVDAERTRIPADGKFHCATETRTLTVDETKRLSALRDPCPKPGRECDDTRLQIFRTAISFWDSTLDLHEGSLDMIWSGGDSHKSKTWTSNDQLRRYSVTFDGTVDAGGHWVATGGTFAQTICREVTVN